MDIWDILSYRCWGGSILLLGWMFLDFLRVNKDHDEAFLLSSREGHDEILEQEREFAEQRDKKKQEPGKAK